jgi:hypothetical protein
MYYNNKTHCSKITEKAKLRMQNKTIAEQLEEIKEYLKEEIPDAEDSSITKQHLM